ncbi:MAG TPA: tetratricopeptide repeat protein, partial [Catalimonadaceae bacterium]|nr:tetratricopeptide repeat protein [Catalimonadaceae bacterium]
MKNSLLPVWKLQCKKLKSIHLLFSGFLYLIFIQFSPGQEKKDPLEDSIQVQFQLGDNAKALRFAKQFAAKTETEKGPKSLEYGRALSKLGLWLVYNSMAEDAETTLNKAFEIQTSDPPALPEHLANTWYAMGKLRELQNQPEKVVECFQKRLEMEKRAYGEISKQVATGNTQIGISLYRQGAFNMAEESMMAALSVYKKLEMAESKEIAELYRFLGILYKDMGNFPKVEQYFSLALPICQKQYGENHAKTGEAYNNMGAAYQMLGNMEMALSYQLKALEIRKKTTGEESDEVGQSYLNLALIYNKLGKIAECQFSQDQAIKLLTKSRGEESEYVGYAYLNAASFQIGLGNYQKSIRYFRKANHIQLVNNGENHPDIGIVHVNLGELFHKMGQYDSALFYANKAITCWKKFQGPSFFGFIIGYSNLAQTRMVQKKYSEAIPWLKKGNEVFLRHILENFPSLTDEEKEDFYHSIEDHVDDYKSFSALAIPQIPSHSADLFDFQLATKGLLLNSSAKWKHRIKVSGDVKLFTQYARWLDYQKKIQAIQQSGDSTERTGLDSLTRLANKIQKELSLRSEAFSKLADKQKYSWKDIQKKLKPGEAVVEIIRSQKFGIVKTIADTSDPQKRVYKLRGLTDTIQYLALLVKPESAYPELVLLPNGNDLEGKYLKYYQNSISKQLPDNQSYQHFWEKIGAKLGTNNRVYFSPDGVFHNLNLNTLFNPKTKKYLLEEKEIRLVTTAKDILTPATGEEEN